MQKRHFLVIAAASRGARFFIKNALRQGHDVTALCRAEDHEAALKRITDVLDSTHLTPGGVDPVETAGTLFAKNSNILEPNTYQEILENNPSIDAVCCFVGVTKTSKMFSREHRLYTKTMTALVDGMRNSRWVETFYHGSSGCEGQPGEQYAATAPNWKFQWVCKLFFNLPAFQDYVASENILADAGKEGLRFVIFRPAFLTSEPAKRHYGFSFNVTAMDDKEHPLRYATMYISREDVAEEILRVALLPETQRTRWFSQGVYLVDMKSDWSQETPIG